MCLASYRQRADLPIQTAGQNPSPVQDLGRPEGEHLQTSPLCHALTQLNFSLACLTICMHPTGCKILILGRRIPPTDSAELEMNCDNKSGQHSNRIIILYP